MSPTGRGESHRRFKVWRAKVFSATWLSYFGYYFSRKPYSIAKGSLERELGFTTDDLAWIYVAFLVAYAVGQFLAGWLGERVGARRALLFGTALTLACNAAFGFTNSVATFAALMFVNGLAQATGWSANVGMMAFWTRHEERGAVMGLWGTCFQVGGILANAVAAWGLGALGFRYAFWLGSVVTLATWAWGLHGLRNRPEDVGLPALVDPPAAESPLIAASNRSRDAWSRALVLDVTYIGAFYFFVKFVRYALWSWAPYLLETRYGLKGDEAGYLSTVFDVGGFLGVIAAGVVSDRVFHSRHALTSWVFTAAMAGACAIAVSWGASSLLVFGVSLFLIGVTLFGPDALMSGAGAIDAGSPRTALVAAAVINGLGSLGAVVQELVLKRLVKGETTASVFVTLFGSSVLALFFLGIVIRRQNQRLAARA